MPRATQSLAALAGTENRILGHAFMTGCDHSDYPWRLEVPSLLKE